MFRFHEELDKRIDEDEYWSDAYPDGVTVDDIMNELADYKMILSEVNRVYCHVTGGMVSKANTYASDVISMYEENNNAIFEEMLRCDEAYNQGIEDAAKVCEELAKGESFEAKWMSRECAQAIRDKKKG